MECQYEHFGVPVKEKLEGMLYYPEYRVWASDYEEDPFRIEWIYFERGSILHPLIQSVPHVCFCVPDIERAVFKKKNSIETHPLSGNHLSLHRGRGSADRVLFKGIP